MITRNATLFLVSVYAILFIHQSLLTMPTPTLFPQISRSDLSRSRTPTRDWRASRIMPVKSPELTADVRRFLIANRLSKFAEKLASEAFVSGEQLPHQLERRACCERV